MSKRFNTFQLPLPGKRLEIQCPWGIGGIMFIIDNENKEKICEFEFYNTITPDDYMNFTGNNSPE